ncbi:MAG: hypothetical protein ACJATN_002857 [Neolewinella sp.]|jgi:hypothetical protein
MNPIDDMFRDGLDGRKGDVPADMWSRVSAGEIPVVPEGEGVDQYFSDVLKNRTGDAPAGMWSRIIAAGIPAAAILDQVFADGLRDSKGGVSAGMWDRIWRGRAASPANTQGFLHATAVVLFMLTLSAWALMDVCTFVEDRKEDVIVTTDTLATPIKDNEGSVAGAKVVNEAGLVNTVASEENRSARTEKLKISAAAQLENNALEAANRKSIAKGPTPLPSAVQQRITSSNSSTANDEAVQAAAENTQPTTSPDEMATDDILRPLISASPAVKTNLAIPALDFVSAGLKVKDRYQPKTPAANSFRAANRHRLQTEFLFGAFYANQQFSAETDTDEFLALRTIRETRENPGLSYQVSLRGAYKLNERLVLRSGLTYSEVRNVFDYEHVVNGRLSLLKINNHVRQLEVPVLLGLRIPGHRLNVSLNAGLLVNLTTSVQGRFLTPNSADPLNLATEGQYRSNLGVGFMTSLSTTYVIGKKQPFVLLVEPFFKAYPGSYTRKGAPLKETYWAAGLQLGVRKGF